MCFKAFDKANNLLKEWTCYSIAEVPLSMIIRKRNG